MFCCKKADAKVARVEEPKEGAATDGKAPDGGTATKAPELLVADDPQV